jgi:hypothetical protein
MPKKKKKKKKKKRKQHQNACLQIPQRKKQHGSVVGVVAGAKPLLLFAGDMAAALCCFHRTQGPREWCAGKTTTTFY